MIHRLRLQQLQLPASAVKEQAMWLSNLRIVLPDHVIERGALRIEGEQIDDVIAGDPPRPAIDGRGLLAIPGIIDMHGDMLEREVEPRPGARFPTALALYELDKRLAAAGVTTAYAALSFYEIDNTSSVRSPESMREIITTLNRLRDDLLVDMLVHARFEVSTPGIAQFLGEMLDAGMIHMLSLMDHTPGQGQYRDIEHYITFIAKWRRVDRSHVEEELRERLRNASDPASNWALARDIAGVAAEQGLPIASHDDDTLEKVDLVASLGATICEFPVTLEAAREARRRGMHIFMGAPNLLRGGSHNGNLSAAEAIGAGVVDGLAADYHPASLLQAAIAINQLGLMPLHAAVRLISSNPARALGLHDRGSIEAGKRADLVLVQPGQPARVRGVLRRGRPIYWDGFLDAVPLARSMLQS